MYEIRRSVELTRIDFPRENTFNQNYRASIVEKDASGKIVGQLVTPFTDVCAVLFKEDKAYVIMAYAHRQIQVSCSGILSKPHGVMPIDTSEEDIRMRLHKVAREVGEDLGKRYEARDFLDNTEFAEPNLSRGGK